MPGTLGKILVIRGGAIGDFILTLPVLAALRESFPQVRLELLGYPHIAQLAQAGGLVDQVLSIEARALASFFARGGPLPKSLTEYFEGFALILSYLYDPDLIFKENVARSSKAQFIAGPHRPDEHGHLHAVEAFLQPLQRLAIFNPDPTPKLDLRHDVTGTDQLCLGTSKGALPDGTAASRWLAVHPGSGSERKNWPEENWAALLAHLAANSDFNVLLVGGEAEGQRLERLSVLLPRHRWQLAQGMPLPDLASLLRQCFGYIGHDSGISHLAAAVGLKGLILWGDSNARIWRPRSPRMALLQAPGALRDLPVAEVIVALQAQLP